MVFQLDLVRSFHLLWTPYDSIFVLQWTLSGPLDNHKQIHNEIKYTGFSDQPDDLRFPNTGGSAYTEQHFSNLFHLYRKHFCYLTNTGCQVFSSEPFRSLEDHYVSSVNVQLIDLARIVKAQQHDVELQDLLKNDKISSILKPVAVTLILSIYCGGCCDAIWFYEPKYYQKSIFSALHNLSHPLTITSKKVVLGSIFSAVYVLRYKHLGIAE